MSRRYLCELHERQQPPAVLLQLELHSAGRISYTFAERDRDSQLMVRSRKWKYIKTLKPFRLVTGLVPKGRRELYDLANDPGETTNLVASEPERVETFEGILARWLNGTPERPERPQSRGEPSKYLRALGYIE